MSIVTFGYTLGDGSGTNSAISFGTDIATGYPNNTGARAVITGINLLNVTAALVGTFQLAIYSDMRELGIPVGLRAVSDILTLVSPGTNFFDFSSNPISVFDGEVVWIALRAPSGIRLDSAIKSPNLVYTGGDASSNPFPSLWGHSSFNGFNRILPVEILADNSYNPSGTELRAPNVVSEPLVDGYSAARLSDILNEPLVGGYSTIRCSLFVCESLQPVEPEGFMSDVQFPTQAELPGISYSIHKKPRFSTRKAVSSSGRNVRNAMMEYPIWTFELTYDYLPDRPLSMGQTNLRTLMGFFLSRQGGFDTFKFLDVDDHIVIGQEIAIGDGVSVQCSIVRSLGNFVEPVGQLDTDEDYTFYADGTPLVEGVDYSITMPNQLVFVTAPAEGVVITGDFQYFFICTFVEDEADFEKFMDKLWQLQQINFESIIQ